MSQRSPVVRSAALTAIGLVLIGSVRIAAGISAEALFGVPGLAFVTAALSVATLATVVGAGGLSAGITKLISQLRGEGDPSGAADLAAFVARLALALSLVGALAAAGYAALDDRLAAGGTLTVLSVAALTLSWGTYLAGKAIAYGEENIKGYVGSEVLGALAFAAALVGVAALATPEAIVLPLVVAYLPVGWFAVSRLARTRSAAELPVRSLANYGIIGSIGSLAGIGFTRATPLVAGFIAGAQGTALVGAALVVLEPLYLAPRAISLVLLPNLSFSTAAGFARRAAETVRASTGMTALFATPFCALLVLERDRLLQVLFSDQIVGGPTLAWFSTAFWISVIGAPAVTALAAIRARDASIPMASSITGFVVAAGIWLAVGSSHGTVGVAVGYLAGSIIQVAYPIVAATGRYRVPWGSLWARLLAVAAVVGIASRFGPRLGIDIVVLAAIGALLAPELVQLYRQVTARRSP